VSSIGQRPSSRGTRARGYYVGDRACEGGRQPLAIVGEKFIEAHEARTVGVDCPKLGKQLLGINDALWEAVEEQQAVLRLREGAIAVRVELVEELSKPLPLCGAEHLLFLIAEAAWTVDCF